jgi:hypothetical protein
MSSVPIYSSVLLDAAVTRCETILEEDIPACVTQFIASGGNVRDNLSDLQEIIIFSGAIGTTFFEGESMTVSSQNFLQN